MQFLLWLRKSKLNKAGTAPVYLRIFLDTHTRSEYATEIRCRPDEWNAAKGRLRGNDDATRDSNSVLKRLLAKAQLTASRLQDAANESPDLPPVYPADVALALRPRAVVAPVLLTEALLAAVPQYSTRPASQDAAAGAVRNLGKWPPGVTLALADFTAKRATEWVAWLAATGASPATRTTYVGLVAGLLKRAAPTHPAVLTGLRRGLSGQTKPRRALAAGWQQELLDLKLTPQQAVARDVLLLQYYLHGSRVGVVVELQWSQIDHRAGRVRYTSHKYPVPVNAKLSPEIAAILSRYEGSSSPLVLPLLPADYLARPELERYRLRKKAIMSVDNCLRRLCQNAGLAHIHSHLARHTLALRAYENNSKDLRVPQQLLGHKNISTTAAYIASLTTTELDAGAANAYD